MSRIGKKLVYLPAGVTATIETGRVLVKGPKGEIARAIAQGVSVSQKNNEEGAAYLEVTVADPDNQSPIWGTTRAHLANMMTGVTQGWSKSLELNGVGFRMKVQGKKLVLELGFSHEVEYALPEGIVATIDANVLTVAGVDKDLVGKVAAEVRALKKPEPYKGKGFRYTDETIRRKAGKAAKSEA